MPGERDRGTDRKKARISSLLYLAAQDTEAARLLSTHNNHYAAYHCQQAVEKLIRVLLIQRDIEPGLDHHLDILAGRLPDDDQWKARLTPFHKYTIYATTYRYATPGGRVPTPPDSAGVASDAATISALIDDARRQFVGT